MGIFVISKRLNGFYKFEFVSRKGKTILVSNSYELRFECEDEIEVLKSSLETSEYLKFKSAKGKCFFKLMLNEKVVAVSRKYSTELLLQKGIDELIKYASKSEIIYFSEEGSIFLDF